MRTRTALVGGVAIVACGVLAESVVAGPSIAETHEQAKPRDSHLPPWAGDISKGPTGTVVGLLIPVISKWGYSIEYRGDLAVVGAPEDRGAQRDHVYELDLAGFAPRLVRFKDAYLGPGVTNDVGLGKEAHLVRVEGATFLPSRYEVTVTGVSTVEGTAGYPAKIEALLDRARAQFDAYLKAQRREIARTIADAGKQPTGPKGKKTEIVYEGYLPYWDDDKKHLIVMYDRRILEMAEYSESCMQGTAGTPPVERALTIKHGHGVELGQEIELDANGDIVALHTYDPVPIRIENGPKPLPRPVTVRGSCSYDVVARAVESSRRAAGAGGGQCSTMYAYPLQELDDHALGCLSGKFEDCHAIYQLEGNAGPLNRCVLRDAERLCSGGNAERCDNAVEIASLYGARTEVQILGYRRKAAAIHAKACHQGNSEACLASAAELDAGSPKDQAEARRLRDRMCNGGNTEACGKQAAALEYEDPVKAISLMQRSCGKMPAGEWCDAVEQMLMQTVMRGGYEDDKSRAQKQKVIVAFCDAGVMHGCFFGGRYLYREQHDLDGAEVLLRKGCFASAGADYRACHLLTKFRDTDGTAKQRMDALCANQKETCDRYTREN